MRSFGGRAVKLCPPPVGNSSIYFLNRGGQGQNRTADTKIFSLLLYRLSYLPTVSVAESRGGP
jgi:hypothetical protein